MHANWELPLLLEGHKKLAIFSDFYPSPLFDCEEAFDRWVASGVLHKEVIDEPFEVFICRVASNLCGAHVAPRSLARGTGFSPQPHRSAWVTSTHVGFSSGTAEVSLKPHRKPSSAVRSLRQTASAN